MPTTLTSLLLILLTLPALSAEPTAAEGEESDRATAALEKLKSAPTDPAANLTAGRFYCFRRGDFPRGLDLLARSRDPALAPLARADLASPEPATLRKVLADKWWEHADREAAAPHAAARCRARAAHWYQLAEPALTGPSKALARQRIDAVAAAAGAPAAAAATRPAASIFDDTPARKAPARSPIGVWTKIDTGSKFTFAPDGTVATPKARSEVHRSGTWTTDADGAIVVAYPKARTIRFTLDDRGRLVGRNPADGATWTLRRD